MSGLSCHPLRDDAELAALAVILIQCFNMKEEHWESYRDSAGPDNFRVVTEGDRLLAGPDPYMTDHF